MPTAATPTPLFSPLLATKLMPPRRGRGTLPRPRLEHLIERIAESSLSVLKAPPGFGKSTLASAWAEAALARGAQVAWLTLDENDDSPERLLLYVAAAIRRGFDGGGEGDEDLSMLPAQHLATLLLNDLERRSEHCFLFIDDYHSVPPETLVAAFDPLVRYAPENLHLVFCGRTDLPPSFFVHLYRDTCLEVDAAQLRFDLDETRDLLLRNGGQTLEAGELVALHHATEGWIAALRASLLSLRQRPAGGAALPKNISGLLDELLAQLPEELVRQLACLAAVEKFSAALAERLTGCASGQALIDELERRQLFLAGLDASAEWFSLHPLFREHLRRRLHPPQLAEALHVAARWFAEQRSWPDAVRCALAAGDDESACEWVAHCAMGMVERGDIMILLDWQRQLQGHLLQSPWQLKFALAWGAALGMNCGSARQLLDEVRGSAQDGGAILQWQCQALEATLLALEDHVSAGARLAAACLPHLGEHPWIINTLFSVVSFGHLCESRWEDFYVVPPVRGNPLEHSRYLFNQDYRLCILGFGELLQGRLAQATALLEEALGFTGHPLLRALPAAFLIQVHYLRGQLDQAARLSLEYLELVTLGAPLDFVASTLTTLVRLSSRHAGQHGARHFIEQGERLAQARKWPRLHVHMLLERTRFGLLEHKPQEALACSQQLDNLLAQEQARATECHDDYAYLACLAALWCEAAGTPRQADLEQAEALRLRARRHNRRPMQIRLGGALALVYWRQRRGEAATACLLEAVQLAQDCDAWQLLFDLPGLDALQQLAAHALQAPAPDEEQRNLLRRLLPSADGIDAPPPDRAANALTGKERHVLELVAQGKSNKEMARLLGIAPETIKSHMKKIFAKLEVESRAQAAVVAKANGLI
ncbi:MULTISPECIES: LuxR C-terminal-related transcriptional regulator [unclassified Pseudomonas]|uniref:LuxR C-terminal-related transcriptional regulator n=1 Tax=unclassified Pseudomonas TaxID=196821 RepID=UPI002447E3FD|nr:MULTISPECIES: LuxR C-terminal-related transcriptional regulator [unclassified Pseudomonas]MDH0896999.1 LuxR C-terminal-related transcriptional regulator [Pseudomonas sp. GD03875]MDH1064253.1 LuxR C-terminal-related transcriptional regulator [Pseudomonas sp. GD03985]